MSNKKIKLPIFEEGESIPKIIHQIYLGESMPPELQRVSEGLKRANPNWEYRFYDDNRAVSFIRAFYGEEVLSCYMKINPVYGAAKADFLRYLIMYKEGGVYLDTKSTFSKSIDECIMPTDKYILCGWQNEKGMIHEGGGVHKELINLKGGEFQQWHIIAVAGSPFLRAVICTVIGNIEEYTIWKFGVGKQGVLRVTGPIPYTLSILPLLKIHSHRYVRFDKDVGLIYSALKNTDEHIKLLGNKHYSKLRTPIVIKKGWRNWVQYIFFSRKIASYYMRQYLHKLQMKTKIKNRIKKYLDIPLEEQPKRPYLDNVQIGKNVYFYFKNLFLCNVVIGDYSYILSGQVKNTIIGKYCSISNYVMIGMDNHPQKWLSTHPFQYDKELRYGELNTLEYDNMFNIEIENDVWIGAGVNIVGNVKISNGAIIGAGSVVTKDVPPYAIVAGCPAKIIKFRFTEEIIMQLLDLKWWELSVEELDGIEFNDINIAIKQVKVIKSNKINVIMK